MNEIINIDSVDVYNKQFGLETLHPLVSVIDMNQATRLIGLKRFNYGIYALFLKMEKACNIKYGRQTYDYQEGTVVCFAPGQTAETTPTTDRPQMNVLGILFHPDLLRGTSLGKTSATIHSSPMKPTKPFISQKKKGISSSILFRSSTKNWNMASTGTARRCLSITLNSCLTTACVFMNGSSPHAAKSTVIF